MPITTYGAGPYDDAIAAEYPIPTPMGLTIDHPITHVRHGHAPCTWVRGNRGEWEVGRRASSLVDVFTDDLTGAKETIATVATRDGRISHVRIETWSTGIVPGTSLSRYARA